MASIYTLVSKSSLLPRGGRIMQVSFPFVEQVLQRLRQTHLIGDEFQRLVDSLCLRLGSQDLLRLLHRRCVDLIALSLVGFAHPLPPPEHRAASLSRIMDVHSTDMIKRAGWQRRSRLRLPPRRE